MSGFTYEKDSDGIVTIIMDMPGQSVNSMNEDYLQYMGDAIDELESEPDSLRGVIISSAKDTFFAGGDLKKILSFNDSNKEEAFNFIEGIKSQLRRLEKLSKPVVAAINGSALGGGYEICLACHHRIVINDSKIKLGLPEVSLGLLPGGGGVVRLVQLLGLQQALPFLVEGKTVNPERGKVAGLVDELANNQEELIVKAKAWIKHNPQVLQPWDQKGHKIPGGTAKHPAIRQLLSVAPATIYKKTQGLMPAPERILAVAAESTLVDFETALRVESRGLVHLMTTAVAKNLITTFFFQLNEINAGGSRPKNVEKKAVKKLGILGAGMMGQGIAYSAAMSGIDVILKDVSQEGADKGKAYSEMLLSKRVKKGRMDPLKMDAVLARITATASNTDLEGCDLIIEAVFEDTDLKARVTKETEPYLAEGGVYGSNTSSLPIGYLAKASKKPENFIGIHFFSPVDKMPLVEIIVGDKTSDETLALAFDFVKQIKKTPIVVNDSRGFFTSRVFGTYLDEGCSLLEEGVDPLLIESMGRQVGYPVGPLAVFDEVSLELVRKLSATNKQLDELAPNVPGKLSNDNAEKVANIMIDEFDRGGRIRGGGFYDYEESGKNIWPGLYERFTRIKSSLDNDDIKDRLLFRTIIESLHCLEEGVLRSVADGNVGGIMGIGIPPQTGGVFQFINTYGLERFTLRSRELADRYGDRFKTPKILQDKLMAGEWF